MTSSFDLLDAVLPPEGRFCAWGIGNYVDQKFFDTREEFDAQIAKLVNRKFNAFFGCAKYGDEDNRKHANALYFRSLWMDIDCGEEKAKPNKNGRIEGYIDQSTGFQAAKDVFTKLNLPRPIVVNSGYGLHFYWPLAETVGRAEWEALSKRLRDLVQEHGLIVDPSVFEASRVLRVPGTINFKWDTEAPVEVLSSKHDVTPYSVWKEILGAPDPEEDTSFLPRRLSPLMESMMENRIKRFKTIMLKSAEGTGCNQLLYCYQNQEEISYNLWRSALSIATHCVDRDSAIHKISQNHPNYNPGETEKKAADIGGPHLCTTFESQNPGGCDGCPHKGKFKSPIVLGTEIAQLDDGDGSAQPADDETGLVASNHPILTGVVASNHPVLPEPYFIAKSGAIYLRSQDEEDPALIYENTFYVVKRMTDPVLGEMALLRLHLPKDGMREFALPLSTMVVKDRLREAIAQKGVATSTKQMESLLYYLIVSVKNLQVTNKAEIMRTQFGWCDNNTKIVVGDREISVEGSFYSPPSSATKEIAPHMQKVGTLEKWKEVFNLYNAPGLEPNAFAALCGFGSLLLKFTGMEGAMINVIHPTSGSGKSTTLYVANSIFGHPRKLGSMWKDTFNTKMHKLGVMNNILNTIDEITNTKSDEFSDMAYGISQGRGKDRMKSQSNEMRVNLTSWQSMTLCSSNASFYERLGLLKDRPDGEVMRLLEYKIEPKNIISTELGKEMFDRQLLENYGHAGDIYAEWLVNNLDELKNTLVQVQGKIDRDAQFTRRERFWSAVAACNITGGLVAKSLGLHDYDMKRIYDWLIATLKEMKEDTAPPPSSVTATLGDFINAHINNILVVDGHADARTDLSPAPKLEPRGELHIRYEPDTQRMFIAMPAFRKYCGDRQIHYKEFTKDLTAQGVLLGVSNKRLSKGMKFVSPAVRAMELDTSKEDFLKVDAYLPASDADRDSQVQD